MACEPIIEFYRRALSVKQLLVIDDEILSSDKQERDGAEYFVNNGGIELLFKNLDLNLAPQYVLRILLYGTTCNIEKVYDTGILNEFFKLLSKKENIGVIRKHEPFYDIYTLAVHFALKLKNRVAKDLHENGNYQFLIDQFKNSRVSINFQYNENFANAQNIFSNLFTIAVFSEECQDALFQAGFPSRCFRKLNNLIMNYKNNGSHIFRSQLGLIQEISLMEVFYQNNYLREFDLDNILFKIYKNCDLNDILTKFSIVTIIENMLKNTEPTNTLINIIECILECDEISSVSNGENKNYYPMMLSILIKSILDKKTKDKKMILDKLKSNQIVIRNIKDMCDLFNPGKDKVCNKWIKFDLELIDGCCLEIYSMIK